ncbi:Dabb family protein [Aquirufa sp. HETE-83D]|uniref:Dabb family protein n=1 Tax=Aquirufa esocilacus TaxID=3096513 RepID=A0ABW6DRP0_9BACT
MSLRHAGIFNFKATVSESQKHEFFVALKALEEISGVEKMEVSRQTSSKNKFKYGFSMEFASNEIYQAYSIHPQHDAFVQEFFIPLVEDFMEIDTEQLM